MRTIPAFLFALIAAAQPVRAETIVTDRVTVEARTVHSGLRHPWGLDFLPGGLAVVTEREGRMHLLGPDGAIAGIAGVPKVAASGQGGLLDVVAAPDFASSRMLYFSFAEPGEGGAGTAVARARLSADTAQPRLEDVEIVFSMARKTGTTHHFGSRLVFHPDGSLFVTIGDRGEAGRAQDFEDHAGAVLRILPDGGIPADNPFASSEEALPEIWSKGHRNPQGAAYDPASGSIWVVEHGARGGDELNRVEAGRNYGWPTIAYGRHYSGQKIGIGQEAPGFEQPVHYWDPSIAPSGLAVYDGDMFPEWRGNFLVGALKYQLLARLERDGGHRIAAEERLFEGRFGRIRDVNVAPDGSIWLLTDESNGAIIRISRR
jgi:glucose/arabinose dehydrogenase